jgi:hypothetical protein
MAKRKATSQNWSDCKAAMRGWQSDKLLALLRELYELNPENQRFLHGRILPPSPQTVEDAIKVLSKVVSESAVWNDTFRHGDAKRIVDQFAKATKDPELVADLLLADLAMSFQTFSQVGDCEPMVDHLYSSLHRLDKELAKLPPETLPPRIEKLAELAGKWGGKFGYGISDELSDFAAGWSERVGDV